MTSICAKCVGEPFLRRLVADSGSASELCEYCEADGPTIDTFQVAVLCDKVISTFYELSSQTMAVVHQGHEPLGDCVLDLVSDLTQVPEAAAQEIVEALTGMIWYDRDSGEDQYGEDPYFVRKASVDSSLIESWRGIEISLRSEARYLNPKVARFLEQVFHDIADHLSAGGSTVLVDAGPSTAMTSLFRARVFQSERALEKALAHPERALGAPPVGVGTNGRMNSPGQPAFYGALSESTAIAEVRPPVGSWVSTAEFEIIRPLRLLDLMRLETAEMASDASLFDPATATAADRVSFLRELARRMAIPVMPESQDRNYLITQVIADYLAMHPTVPIDGIVYRSAQGGDESLGDNVNVVLFCRAAFAQDADGESPTAQAELREYLDEEPGSYFRPTIVYRDRKQPEPWMRQHGPQSDPALKLVRDAIRIHRIQAVEFRTESSSVEVIDIASTSR